MLFIIIGIAALVLPIAGIVIFLRSRKLLREAKNYERSFKMVPLLIHLPPLSDDIDSETRDARDVADENISRATTMYNILASINTKGFKSKYYGQRHIGIEIVAVKGFVHIYAVVPLPLIPIVEQAVTSAYPSARLEEVADHNIFSPVGKLSGTSGGEIVLKESYAYPIGNYQEIKRDTMQSLLNSLSGLQNEDGVGIQILFRPAKSEWTKHAKSIASKKRKGTDKKTGGLEMLKHIITAPAKPPEYKDGGDQKPLSNLDQSIVDAIDEKTRSAGFEVLIRVIASSNLHQRAMTIQSNIVATFALFDSPGRNGFKFAPAKDIEKFVQGYIMRLFPQEADKNILNTNELATLFHFPDQKSIPTTQLERQQSKQTDGPRNVSDNGITLGYNIFRGTKKRINYDPTDRRRHMYVIGQTGTGKSVFLKNCAVQDMLNGEGFCFIDPHGDAVEELLAMVPRERTEDIIYFCPAEMDYPMGLNIFEFQKPEQKDFLVQEAINMLYKLYDPQKQGIIGPRYEHLFRNAALTVMAGPDPNVTGGTLIDMPKLFNDKEFVAQKLQYVTDQLVLDFWQKEMPASERSNDFGEVKSWFVSKFGAFLSNIMMRNIIGQTRSAFNLREIMDQKKILLVNLSKGKTGELNSKLLGMIFVMQFQAAAMSRADVDASQRPDFCLYVDEFQNYATDSFATILSEARKFGLNLIVANQFTTQLTDEIRDAVFGNVGTIISFRVGTQDAEALQKVMQPIFDSDDLQRVPNFNMVVRTLINGIPTQPFSMQGLPPLGSENQKLVQALIQLSAAKYGRPRAQVEAELIERLAVKEASATTADLTTGMPPASSAPVVSQKPPVKQPSFLDDWLAKRSTTSPASAATPRPLPAPNQQPAPPVLEPVQPVDQTLEPVQPPAQKEQETRQEAKQEVRASVSETPLSLADQIKASLGTAKHPEPSPTHKSADEEHIKIERSHDDKKGHPQVPKHQPKPQKHQSEGELEHDDVLHLNK
jgi:hypothetical protein